MSVYVIHISMNNNVQVSEFAEKLKDFNIDCMGYRDGEIKIRDN